MVRFITMTGLRRGEAIALRWENVDLDRGVLAVTGTAQRFRGQGIVVESPKSQAGRRAVAIDPDTVQMLRDHRGRQLLRAVELDGAFEDNGLVFPGPRGRLMDPPYLTRAFKKMAAVAGVPHMRLHDLRHGHAAGLIRSGAHMKVIQSRLGHASAAFTMQVYGHIEVDMQEDAANAYANRLSERARIAKE